MAKLKNSWIVEPVLKRVRKLQSFRVVALIGTIIFFVSMFLPLASPYLFDTTQTISLLDLYSATISQAGQSSAGDVNVPVGAYGILLTVFLFPLAVILGFIGVARRTVALAAGIIGIICWLGAVIALSGLDLLQYTGIGIYLGFVGAIILMVAYGLKPRTPTPLQAPLAPAPPPPPPPQ
jgi:hypothetical protein